MSGHGEVPGSVEGRRPRNRRRPAYHRGFAGPRGLPSPRSAGDGAARDVLKRQKLKGPALPRPFLAERTQFHP